MKTRTKRGVIELPVAEVAEVLAFLRCMQIESDLSGRQRELLARTETALFDAKARSRNGTANVSTDVAADALRCIASLLPWFRKLEYQLR